MTSQVLPILPISSFVYKLLLGAVHKGYPTLPLVSRFAKMGYEDIYRAIGNYCDAGSTLFGAEISISHKFCFFKNFCLGYDLSDNMKHFFCVMNF